MSNIVERLGVLAASLANPQVAVEAQREIKRLRALVSSLEASPMSEEALDILQSENAKLKVLLREAKETMSHAEVFISSREKMHETGLGLYLDLLRRLRAALGENQ